MLWKCRDDISNGSRIIVLTDRQTNTQTDTRPTENNRTVAVHVVKIIEHSPARGKYMEPAFRRYSLHKTTTKWGFSVFFFSFCGDSIVFGATPIRLTAETYRQSTRRRYLCGSGGEYIYDAVAVIRWPRPRRRNLRGDVQLLEGLSMRRIPHRSAAAADRHYTHRPELTTAVYNDEIGASHPEGVNRTAHRLKAVLSSTLRRRLRRVHFIDPTNPSFSIHNVYNTHQRNEIARYASAEKSTEKNQPHKLPMAVSVSFYLDYQCPWINYLFLTYENIKSVDGRHPTAHAYKWD